MQEHTGNAVHSPQGQALTAVGFRPAWAEVCGGGGVSFVRAGPVLKVTYYGTWCEREEPSQGRFENLPSSDITQVGVST